MKIYILLTCLTIIGTHHIKHTAQAEPSELACIHDADMFHIAAMNYKQIGVSTRCVEAGEGDDLIKVIQNKKDGDYVPLH